MSNSFLLITAMGLAALAASAASTGTAQTRPENDWRTTHLCRACLAGPSKEEVKDMAEMGADVIQANLNACVTDGAKDPGILGGDPVNDFVEYTHSLGAKATGYLNTRLSPLLKEHPDWIARNEKGQSISGDQAPSACQNSPYGQHLIDRMAEYTKKTKIDGWWLDCWTSGVQTCWCKYCSEQFKAETGLDMPAAPDTSDPRFTKYLEWRDRTAERFFARMREAVNSARPDVHIWVNFSPGPAQSPLPFNDNVFRAVESPTVEQWLAGHLDNALAQPYNEARIRGLAGSRESEIWMVPNPLQWDRTTTPDVEVMARVLTIITYGSVVQFPTSPGRSSQMKIAFDAIRTRKKWTIGAEPLKWAAIVQSYRTPEFYSKGDAIHRYYREVMGIFRALSEEHIPVQIVTERDVEAWSLSAYKLAILPNDACMTGKAMAKVREFVQAGGGLIATHETSLYDSEGSKLEDFALADLLGAHFKGKEEYGGWNPDRLWIDDRSTAKDKTIDYARWQSVTSTPRDWLGSVDWAGSALNVEADGGEVMAERNGRGNGKPTWPALVRTQQGKGRVAYFPMEIGSSYYDTSYPYQRRWLYQNALWAAGGTPPVQVKGPLCLLSTYWQQNDGKRLVVHLLNDNSSSGRRAHDAAYLPIREEVIPLHDIEVTCRVPGVRRATLQPENIRLSLKRTKEGVSVVVPKVEMHSMVVFE